MTAMREDLWPQPVADQIAPVCLDWVFPKTDLFRFSRYKAPLPFPHVFSNIIRIRLKEPGNVRGSEIFIFWSFCVSLYRPMLFFPYHRIFYPDIRQVYRILLVHSMYNNCTIKLFISNILYVCSIYSYQYVNGIQYYGMFNMKIICGYTCIVCTSVPYVLAVISMDVCHSPHYVKRNTEIPLRNVVEIHSNDYFYDACVCV